MKLVEEEETHQEKIEEKEIKDNKQKEIVISKDTPFVLPGSTEPPRYTLQYGTVVWLRFLCEKDTAVKFSSQSGAPHAQLNLCRTNHTTSGKDRFLCRWIFLHFL